MAQSKSDGSGIATIPATQVQLLLREATGLPSTFFLTMDKAKLLADGSLEAKYSFSTSGQPPAPTAVSADA